MDAIYRRWALRIAEMNGDAEGQWEVYLYALRFWVSTAINFALLLALGWLFDCISLIIAATAGISLFRAFAGGAHHHRAEVCSAMTMFVMAAIVIVARMPIPVEMVTAVFFPILLLAFWSVYRYAPADTPNKPIVGEERAHFRRLSYIIVTLLALAFSGFLALGFTGIVLAGALGMLWQSFSMTPHGYSFSHAIDDVVEKVTTTSIK
ncbi:hypothetical protein GTO89_10675 [Heliobacterium gestii]|uniref:Accessory gene regulator B n=1 Tax=Heliomicrobium gestii TaxID=2699 RepID=A0A845LJ88_HELGE|nr:accessory gene regulator B family protein [Heliomicrobium gestii]MBM7867082.1 accessory gene regulator B [Heliomicrobium gestii]MZP43503.1 hypothetical protein [Heliomicrobium gestii]